MFPETAGQRKAVQLLSRAVANDRLAHAYLFSGPEGVGKRTTARQFASLLLCQERRENVPCGKCTSCVQFVSGNNPDFVNIRPQGAVIKIDQVRELKKALGFPPLESPRRVILMEDVHTMRREAGNSLLKLLEEPPPDNVLLLTGVDSEPMLPTIISRCQVVPFFPLTPDTAARIISERNSALSPEEARHLADLSGGCPGIASSIDTGELLPVYDKIINGLLDPGDSEAEQIEAALGLAQQAAELKEGLEQLFDLLRHFFREAMLAGLHVSAGGGTRPPPDRNVLQARERWNLQQLSDKVQVIDFVEKALARNCNRMTACEVLFLQLLNEN